MPAVISNKLNIFYYLQGEIKGRWQGSARQAGADWNDPTEWTEESGQCDSINQFGGRYVQSSAVQRGLWLTEWHQLEKLQFIAAYKLEEIPDCLLFITNILKLHVSIINGFNQRTVGVRQLLFLRKIDDVTNLNGIESWVCKIDPTKHRTFLAARDI